MGECGVTASLLWGFILQGLKHFLIKHRFYLHNIVYVLNVTELCTLKCLTFVMCILHQFLKWRPRRRKRKHTHIRYFFFKVPDSQKTDNLKRQEKLSVLRFLFFNWDNYKSESFTQEDWAYLDPHNGSHKLKKKKTLF